MKKVDGALNASGMRFALVLGRFNSTLGEKLLDAAADCLIRHGAEEEALTLVPVPGAFEIPQAARRLAESGDYDAVVALGVIIRGATSHYDHLCEEVTRGLGVAAEECGIPVTYGVVTAENLEQALERCGTKAGNKGWDAALAAVEMAALWRKTGKKTQGVSDGS